MAVWRIKGFAGLAYSRNGEALRKNVIMAVLGYYTTAGPAREEWFFLSFAAGQGIIELI